MEEKFELDDVPKENIYRVPEGYFDSLPSVIMQRCEPAGEKQWLHWLRWRYSPLRLGLATLAVGGALLSGLLLNQPSPTEPVPTATTLAGIPDDDIVQYLLTSGEVDHLEVADLSVADADFWQEVGEEEGQEN